MRFVAVPIAIAFLALYSCHKEDLAISGCIQDKIKYFNNYSCDSGANVMEYYFLGKPVYVFSMGACGGDLFEDVLDADCNMLGSLGGITGNTKIDHVDFSTAEYKRTVWSK